MLRVPKEPLLLLLLVLLPHRLLQVEVLLPPGQPVEAGQRRALVHPVHNGDQEGQRNALHRDQDNL